jgi:hypothetical protein
MSQHTYAPTLAACRPEVAPPPPDGVFEIGLTMAGAISAGAYTAGTIDFLIEAMDAWYAAKNEPSGTPVPPHQVSIKVITGASAGAITAAIATAALRYPFKHCRAGTVTPDEQPPSGNPLYDIWVKKIDITKLLRTDDLKAPNAPASLLDSTCLTQLTEEAMNFSMQGAASRPYLADPLKLVFTVTGLRGVPYAISMRGNDAQNHEMTAHADWLRFAVSGLGMRFASTNAACPDEIALTYPNNWSIQSWRDLGTAALASGAFPIGLAPRLINRKSSDYDYRYVMRPGDGAQPAELEAIYPAWQQPVDSSYSTLCVDGGVMNNEPFDLARTELAGALGRNPRTGVEAKRAVLMIDPFPDPAQPGLAREGTLIEAAMGLLTAWKEQARFKPLDIALAQDSAVYSRFLLTPSRGEGRAISNGADLACGALGGFSGFLHRTYRHHDYLLGRRNCQRFLAQHFSLPEGNPLFKEWSDEMKQAYRIIMPDGSIELPIIPLMDSLRSSGPGACEEALPAWPVGQFRAEEIRDAVNHRAEALIDALTSKLSWFQRFILKLGMGLLGVKSRIVDMVIDKIQKALDERKL